MKDVSVTIIIDTSQMSTVNVGVRRSDGTALWSRELMTAQRSQRVLPLLTALLEESHIQWNQIQAIEIHPGPGSYTGLRVGFAIANALGYLLHIPVNGSVSGSQVFPSY